MKTLSNQKKQQRKKIIILSTVVAVVLVAALASAYIITTSQQSARQTAEENTEKYGSGKTTPSKDTPLVSGSNSGGSTSTPKDPTDENGDMPTTNQPDNIKPANPTGTFVSNHSPNIDGSPRPNTINSTCATSPGVLCYIEFKNGTAIRTLAAQKADVNGNTVWNWTLSDIGITQGTWEISAVAKNGVLESRTKDPISFEVGP